MFSDDLSLLEHSFFNCQLPMTFFNQEMLELTEKPLEEQAEGAQNGLKVVEMEPEMEPVTEAEGQLIPPAGEPVPESITPPSNTDLPGPLKEDPAQSSQSDGHLTSQDMRRAKRIRVRRETLCSPKLCSDLDIFFGVVVAMISFTTVCLSSSMHASLKGGCAGRSMAEKHELKSFLSSFSIVLMFM